MKRSSFFSLLLMLTFAGFSVAVLADAAQEARRSIQARYDQFDRSYMKKDFKGVSEVFTPECIFKLNGEGRSMAAIRVIKGMEAVSKNLTISHARTRILSVKSTPKGLEISAAWTGDSAYAPSVASKDDPPRRAKVKQTVHDTWKQTEKGWQIIGRVIQDDDDASPNANK